MFRWTVPVSWAQKFPLGHLPPFSLVNAIQGVVRLSEMNEMMLEITFCPNANSGGKGRGFPQLFLTAGLFFYTLCHPTKTLLSNPTFPTILLFHAASALFCRIQRIAHLGSCPSLGQLGLRRLRATCPGIFPGRKGQARLHKWDLRIQSISGHGVSGPALACGHAADRAAECLGFAGVLFGWASLVFVFKKERYFQELCDQNVGQLSNATALADCKAQDEKFSLIFTLASFMNNFVTMPTGYIFDRFKTTVTRLIAIFLYTSASLTIAFTSANTAVLLFLAMPMLTVGGILFLMTNLQIGNLFGKHRSTIITLFNGAFDSSSAVFLVIKLLYQQDISLKTSFLFISVCSVWHVGRTLFLMPRGHIPYPVPANYRYGLCSGNDSGEEKKKPVEAKKMEQQSKELLSLKEETPAWQPEVHSFWKYAFSRRFAWHLVWLSVIQLWHYLFIGTLNSLLTTLTRGNRKRVSTYTNAFAITQFFGVLCAPWNGLLMDRLKQKYQKEARMTVPSLVLTSLLCLGFALCASVPFLPLQYVTFILQVIGRSFLYGGNAAFLTLAFPAEHFGKLFGLAMALSAVVSLLQFPIFTLIKGPLKDDPLYVNVTLMLVTLLTLVHPFLVYRECQAQRGRPSAAL